MYTLIQEVEILQSFYYTQNVEIKNRINKILEKLDYTCEKGDAVEILTKYAQYLELKEEGKIDIGNRNIIIESPNEFYNAEPILEAIRDILRCYGNENIEYQYYDDKIQNDIQGITVIDSGKINVLNNYCKKRILKKVYNEAEKIFVFIIRGDASDFYNDLMDNNLVYLCIDTAYGQNSENDKYIKNILKSNGLGIENKCRLFKCLSNISSNEINYKMFNLILQCHIKGINTISDATLDDLNLFRIKEKTKNARERNTTGYQDLNNMIGLENVKEQVRKIINYVKINKKRNMPITLHMVFEGNPRSRKNGSK